MNHQSEKIPLRKNTTIQLKFSLKGEKIEQQGIMEKAISNFMNKWSIYIYVCAFDVVFFFVAHFLLQFVENLTKIFFLCKYSSQALNLICIKLTLDMINRLAAFPGCPKLTPFFGSGPSMLNQFLTPFTFAVTWHIPLACRWLLDLWFIVKLFKKKHHAGKAGIRHGGKKSHYEH